MVLGKTRRLVGLHKEKMWSTPISPVGGLNVLCSHGILINRRREWACHGVCWRRAGLAGGDGHTEILLLQALLVFTVLLAFCRIASSCVNLVIQKSGKRIKLKLMLKICHLFFFFGLFVQLHKHVPKCQQHNGRLICLLEVDSKKPHVYKSYFSYITSNCFKF